MTPESRRGVPGGKVNLAIKKLARETGGDVQEIQTLYVLESLLARISASTYRDDFVLKGGVLLAAFAARRPTKDIDLQAAGFSNDADEVKERIGVIATIDLDDGVVFDLESIKATAIRDGDADEYSGVRVRLIGRLDSSRLTVGIDVSFGDPIWPDPQLIEIPQVVSIGQPVVKMNGYPLTMVFAEKIVTALYRGSSNTRWRDFADIYTLAQLHQVTATELRESLETVAKYRSVVLSPLFPSLAEMPVQAQWKWQAWCKRMGRQQELPEMFQEVLRFVAEFADPVLNQTATGWWDMTTCSWSEKSVGIVENGIEEQ